MDAQDILSALGLSDENEDTDFEIAIKMEVGLKSDASQDSEQVDSAPNQPVEIDDTTFTIPLTPNDMSVENVCFSEKVTNTIKANIIAQLASMVENAKRPEQKGSKAPDSESESFRSNKKGTCGIISDDENSGHDDSLLNMKRTQLMDIICNELDTLLKAAENNSENIPIIQQVKQENNEDSETEEDDPSYVFPTESSSSAVNRKHGYNTRSRNASTIQAYTGKEEPKESVCPSTTRTKSKDTSSVKGKNRVHTNISTTSDKDLSISAKEIEQTQHPSKGPDKHWTEIAKESVSPSTNRTKSKSVKGEKRVHSNISTTSDTASSIASNEVEQTQDSPESPNKHWTEIYAPSSILQTGTKKCKICGKCFKGSCSRKQLDRHWRFHNIKRFICNFCFKGFDMKYQVENHERIHLGKKQFACTTCDAMFNTKFSLRSHVTKKHLNPPGQNMYMKCGECEKTLTKQHMSYHKKIHKCKMHYQCDYCGKVFVRKAGLISHIETHMGISCVCDVCGQVYRNEQTLKKHMICHQEEFQCETCGDTFDSFDSFKHHLKQHSKKCVCDICGAQSLSQAILKVHMTVHSGEKPFVCDICGRMFARKQNMETHLKLHLGIYKYECNICKKKFSQNWNLRKHTESCHKDILDI